MNQVILVSTSYTTFENAVQAVEKQFGETNLRYCVMRNEAGRYFVMFLGADGLKHGVQLAGHCIIL